MRAGALEEERGAWSDGGGGGAWGEGVREERWREMYRRSSLAAAVARQPSLVIAAMDASRRASSWDGEFVGHANSCKGEFVQHTGQREAGQAKAEAIALVMGAKCLLNARYTTGVEESEGLRRALELGRQALTVTRGSGTCIECSATARAHEIIAVALLKLRYSGRITPIGHPSPQDWASEVHAILLYSCPNGTAQE
jgi:hypothetical protein